MMTDGGAADFGRAAIGHHPLFKVSGLAFLATILSTVNVDNTLSVLGIAGFYRQDHDPPVQV